MFLENKRSGVISQCKSGREGAGGTGAAGRRVPIGFRSGVAHSSLTNKQVKKGPTGDKVNKCAA